MTVYARDGVRVRAYAGAAMIAALRARGLDVVVLKEDYRPAPSPARDDAYHSPEALNQALVDLAAAYPSLATIERLGTSVEGVPILGLRLGNPSGVGVRVLGGHHGDELPAVELTLELARTLLAKAQAEADTARLLAGAGVLVAPLVNPDGARRRQRYNARNVDLNRNYNYGFSSAEYAAGDHAFSEPETRAVALDNDYHRYATSLTYHTGAINIGYPLNDVTDPLATDAPFDALARRYQTLVTTPGFWVTRGAAWYTSFGDTNDYSLGRFGGVDFTVEISSPEKTPSGDQVPGIIAAQMPAALDWIARAGQSALVVVRDAATGRPLYADVDSGLLHTTTAPESGLAALALFEENTTLTVSAPGFASTTLTLPLPPPGSTPPAPSAVDLSPRPDGLVLPVPDPRDFASDEAIAFLIQPPAPERPSVVRARHTGEDDIVFACAAALGAWRCVAGAKARRPGYYDLQMLTAGGREALVQNALFLSDHDAAPRADLGASAQNGAVAIAPATDVSLAWLVERGAGPIALSPSWQATYPPLAGDLELVYVAGGALYRQVLVQVLPRSSPQEKVTRRGCAATPGVDCAALVIWFACRRCARSRRRSA